MQIAARSRATSEDVAMIRFRADGAAERYRLIIGSVVGLVAVAALVGVLSVFRSSLTTASGT